MKARRCVTCRKHRSCGLFWSSLAAFAGALVLFFVAVGLVYASGGFVLDGPDVVGVEPTAVGWWMIGVAGFTVLVIVLAALAQLIAWVAAVVDTAELSDKTWFIVLLVTGLVGVGFVAMIAYVVAGPDRKRVNLPPVPAVDAGSPTRLAA